MTRTTSDRSCFRRCSRTGSVWSTTRTWTRSSASPLRVEIRGQEDGPSFHVLLSDRSKSDGSRAEQSALRQLAWQLPGTFDRFSLTSEEIAALRKAIRPETAEVDPVVVADDFRVVGIFRDDDRR